MHVECLKPVYTATPVHVACYGKNSNSAHIQRCGLELQALESVKNLSASSEKAEGQVETSWEVVMEKKNFKVWRRPIEGSHLCEYRGKPALSQIFDIQNMQ